MGEIATLSVVLDGDVGGQGISRFHVKHPDGTRVSSTELTQVAVAVNAMYVAMEGLLSKQVTYTVQPTARVFEESNGALLREDPIPGTPAPITGSTLTAYAAGVGARIYWHTSTVRLRRVVRGATFVTPMTTGAFTATGDLSSSTVTEVVNATTQYLGPVEAAGLVPIIYSRAKTSTSNDGIACAITAVTCSSTPASLRSRRV